MPFTSAAIRLFDAPRCLNWYWSATAVASSRLNRCCMHAGAARFLDRDSTIHRRAPPSLRARSSARHSCRGPRAAIGKVQFRCNRELCGVLSSMAREGIEPPTRGVSGRQRLILSGLSRSFCDPPATSYDNSTEHRASPRALVDRPVQALTRYGKFSPASRYSSYAPREANCPCRRSGKRSGASTCAVGNAPHRWISRLGLFDPPGDYFGLGRIQRRLGPFTASTSPHRSGSPSMPS
jgi:hypothetical protein